MKRLTASILAMGLAAATVGTAAAQSSGYYPQSDGYGQYGQPSVDRYGQSSGAQYDYARVVRVDPVFESGYRSSNYRSSNYGTSSYRGNASRNCYTRNDGYVGSDPYYGNGDRSDGYYVGDDDYRNDGYQDYGRNSGGYRTGGSQAGRTVATVIGGVLGAAIGSQVGGGSARYATAAVGSMVGGIAGQQVYEANQRNRYPRTGAVTVCDPIPADGNGYGSNGYYPASDRGVSAYDVTYEYANRRYVTRTDYHPGDRIRVRVDVRPE